MRSRGQDRDNRDEGVSAPNSRRIFAFGAPDDPVGGLGRRCFDSGAVRRRST